MGLRGGLYSRWGRHQQRDSFVLGKSGKGQRMVGVQSLGSSQQHCCSGAEGSQERK